MENRHKAVLGLLSFVYLFFGIISIVHTVEYWGLMNETQWAVMMAVANAVGVVTSIMVAMYSKKLGHVIFVLTFLMEILGNVFYSYHWLVANQESRMFDMWADLHKWAYGAAVGFDANDYEASYGSYRDSLRILTAWLGGAYVPVMQGITFFTLLKVRDKISLSLAAHIPAADAGGGEEAQGQVDDPQSDETASEGIETDAEPAGSGTETAVGIDGDAPAQDEGAPQESDGDAQTTADTGSKKIPVKKK